MSLWCHRLLLHHIAPVAPYQLADPHRELFGTRTFLRLHSSHARDTFDLFLFGVSLVAGAESSTLGRGAADGE